MSVEKRTDEALESVLATRKGMNFEKIGDFVVNIYEIFGETVRGRWIEEIKISLDGNEIEIRTEGKKKFLSAEKCKKSVADKISNLTFIKLNENEQKHAQRLLEKGCNIKANKKALKISLK